jgi:hypothetical protein
LGIRSDGVVRYGIVREFGRAVEADRQRGTGQVPPEVVDIDAGRVMEAKG